MEPQELSFRHVPRYTVILVRAVDFFCGRKISLNSLIIRNQLWKQTALINVFAIFTHIQNYDNVKNKNKQSCMWLEYSWSDWINRQWYFIDTGTSTLPKGHRPFTIIIMNRNSKIVLCFNNFVIWANKNFREWCQTKLYWSCLRNKRRLIFSPLFHINDILSTDSFVFVEYTFFMINANIFSFIVIALFFSV